jgi:transcriptional antiterminator NusG
MVEQEDDLVVEDVAEDAGNGPESPPLESEEGDTSGAALSDATVGEEEKPPSPEEVPSDGASMDDASSNEPTSPAAEIAELAEQTEADALEEAGLAEADDDREWYVIHCYSGREQKVKQKLEGRIRSLEMEDKILQVVVPTEDEMELRRGERRTVERRIFPGYLLVQMILDDESWYAVQDTPGVIGFVGMGDRPTPLRPAEVESIMARMEAEAPKIKVSFDTGEKVRIIDGPFDGFIGMVDSIDMERAKVHVMVSFFGRETPVELDFLQVERI